MGNILGTLTPTLSQRERERTALVLLAALLLVLLFGCGGTPQLSGEAVIYVAAPLSGDQADGGQSVLGGARKRADEANRAGGVLDGKKVVVKGLDDQADEAVAEEVAQKVEQAVKSGETVLGVVGHYNSGPTDKALAIYRQIDLVVVSPSSSNPDLTKKGYAGFFRVCASDATQGPYAARFLAEKGFKKIALVHTDNEYADGLAREIKSGGLSPVVEVRIKAESPTFAQGVAQVKAASPDAIFFAGDYPDGIVLVRELREAGITVPIMLSDANFVDYVIDELGKSAEGVYVSAISPDPRAVAPAVWLDEYRELEARNPGIDSTTGYSAADVLVSGVLKAKSADGKQIAQAIHNLDLKTLVGQVRYDPNGDLTEQRVYIFQVQDGRFVQVSPKAGS
jgi:branched-chain amino acid transport system substrate-binding protein